MEAKSETQRRPLINPRALCGCHYLDRRRTFCDRRRIPHKLQTDRLASIQTVRVLNRHWLPFQAHQLFTEREPHDMSLNDMLHAFQKSVILGPDFEN